jgi:hypothetical protein
MPTPRANFPCRVSAKPIWSRRIIPLSGTREGDAAGLTESRGGMVSGGADEASSTREITHSLPHVGASQYKT